jgi:hypothetical protein
LIPHLLLILFETTTTKRSNVAKLRIPNGIVFDFGIDDVCEKKKEKKGKTKKKKTFLLGQKKKKKKKKKKK